jgi:hypothetical protein
VISVTPKNWQKLMWTHAYKFTKGKSCFMHLVEQLSFYQSIILICWNVKTSWFIFLFCNIMDMDKLYLHSVNFDHITLSSLQNRVFFPLWVLSNFWQSLHPSVPSWTTWSLPDLSVYYILHAIYFTVLQKSTQNEGD